MASKRHIRRKACEGKIKFSNQPDAERAAASYSKTYHCWMTAYKCVFCGGFHFGHPPKKIKRAIINRMARRPDND